MSPPDGWAAGAALAAYAGAWRLAALLAYRAAARRLRAQGVPEGRLPERRGRATLPRPTGRLAWLHAASVGEGLSVLPLVERLTEAGVACLVTTITASSAAILAHRLPAGALHQFAPLDDPGSLKRFLGHWRPDLAVLVESELWPGLVTACARRGVPLALVNARMSDRSLARWRRAGPLAGALLRRFDLVTAQTEAVAGALVALGTRPDRTRVGGNMKAAAKAPPVDGNEMMNLEAIVGDRLLWCAVSTHPGEEEVVLDAHVRLLRDHPDALLILAPRHPERRAEVSALIAARALFFATRSASQNPAPDRAVLLADTLGETGLWFTLAPVVFLGGSLVPVGGHNPYEPAACGAALLTGPHVASAQTDWDALQAIGLAQMVTDADALAAAVGALWADPARSEAAGEAARRLRAIGQDSLDALAHDLLALIREASAPRPSPHTTSTPPESPRR